MHHQTTIPEDLTVLLLDDRTGVIAGAETFRRTLGAAVLVELVLHGRARSDTDPSGEVTAHVVAGVPLPDRLLQRGLAVVAERGRSLPALLHEIGAALHHPVLAGLLERGLIRHESRRLWGQFRVTGLPSADGRHEEDLVEAIRAVLEDRVRPDARLAALIALLSAGGSLAALRPAWSAAAIRRAHRLEVGFGRADHTDPLLAATVREIASLTGPERPAGECRPAPRTRPVSVLTPQRKRALHVHH